MPLVRDVMEKDPAVLRTSDSATHARAMVRDHEIRAYLVMEDARLEGILTRGDILKVTSNKSNLLVGGIMTPNPVTADPEEDLFSCAKKILKSGVRQLPVVKDGRLEGLISSEDILSALVRNEYNPVKKKVEEIMSADVVFCSPDDEIPGIWDLMSSSGFSGLPVVLKKKVVGMITRMDLFTAGFRLSKESGKARSGQVGRIMKTPALTLLSDMDVRAAAQAMLHKGIIRMPVVDEKEHLQGIVDIEDIIRAYML